MYDLKKIRERVNSLIDEGEAIFELVKAEDREPTKEERLRIDAIYGTPEASGELAQAQAEEKRAEHFQQVNAEIAARRAAERRQFVDDEVESPQASLPKIINKYRTKHYANGEEAYCIGQFIAASVLDDAKAKEFVQANRNRDIFAAHSGSDNTKGGYAVPETMENTIIRLVEDFGVFRQFSMVYPMPSASVLVPRRTGGFTSYFVGENDSITSSDLTLNQAKLDAKKLAVLTQVSSELNEDSIAALADLITEEIAFAFANKEDECGFNGDGTSTYGGIVGLKSALAAGSIVDAATGNDSVAEHDLADYEAVIGKLPMYPGIQPRWFMHKAVWMAGAGRLMDAAGGNRIADLGMGPEPMFLGYPVTFAQVLDSTTGTNASTIQVYFGDLRMASTFGVKRGVSIRADESLYFASDAIAIRGTERFDINVHERGDASNAGPVVALKNAS